MKTLFALLFALAIPCQAADFDTTEKALYGTFIGLQVLDAVQTMQISRHPDQFRETNPLLGSHPSDARIIGTKLLFSGALTWALWDSSHQTRKLSLGTLDAFYIGVVDHNYRVGIRIGFK